MFAFFLARELGHTNPFRLMEELPASVFRYWSAYFSVLHKERQRPRAASDALDLGPEEMHAQFRGWMGRNNARFREA